jgi:PmbA protein
LESTGGEHVETRLWSEIDLILMAENAVEKALGYLKAESISGRKISVILRNQVAASLMGVMLSSPINANTVQQGGSPFGDRLGEMIAADDINILDIGTMPSGFGSSPFDDEGHPTQKTPVIEGGILSNFLYDSYTAQKEERKSTGNAWRSGYSAPPNPAPSNLVLERGTAGLDEILQETRKGLYVEETIGGWLSNPVSGNLNATVTHGYLIEEGELTKPVKGVVLAGNYHEVLKEGFETIGNDLRNSGNFYSPTVKIHKLTVAGE